MTVQKLKEAVKELSPQERILFVKFVLDTIADDTSTESPEHLSDEWKEELEKRSKAYGSGNDIPTSSWSDIKANIIKKNS